MIKPFLQTLLIAGLFTATLLNAARAGETRCGWLQNPTPGNWYLTDADATWTLSTQSDEPNASLEIPSLNEKKGWFVNTGGASGYACVCLNVTVDKQNQRILTASKGKQLPLKKCTSDRSLPKPE